MTAHVPDSRLRGRVRAEKRAGHRKGGNAAWRNYPPPPPSMPRKAPQPPPAESWWLGLDREAFAAELAKRQPDPHPVLPHDPIRHD